jgi:type IV pilus assembly protein PilP
MKRLSRVSVKILIVLTSSLILTGCLDQNMGDLESYVAEVKARKAGHIEPVPEITPVKTYAYQGAGRRNPFEVMVEESEAAAEELSNGLSPDLNRRKEELEGYPLDSLRMVGLLEQLDTVWALVRTQESTIYRVKAGNYLGQNHGQITQITEQQIELTEIVSDGRGGYSERQASMALAEQ